MVAEDAARTVSLNGQRTAAVDLGAGPPLLVLHSVALDWRLARGLIQHLPDARVIAFDLPSHGASTAPPASFSLERCAADAVALLDRLDVRRAHLAGFSLGGAVAQLLALEAPERVASLVLTCTMAAAKPDLYRGRAEAAEAEGMEAMVEPTMQRWFSRPTASGEGWYVDYAAERIRAASVGQWSSWWRRFAEFDILARLPEIEVPVTAIAGEVDRSTTVPEMRSLAAALRARRFEVLPGAPHLAPLVQPAAVAGLIREHLGLPRSA